MNEREVKAIKAVNKAAKSMIGRTLMPILSGAHVTLGRIEWTNLDTSIILDGIYDAGDGRAARSREEKVIPVGQVESWLDLDVYTPMKVEDYPLIPDALPSGHAASSIPVSALKAIQGYMAADETRLNLFGVKLEGRGDYTRMYATNSYILARIETNGSRPAQGDIGFIPAPALKAAVRLFKKGNVEVRLDDKHIQLTGFVEGFTVHIMSRVRDIKPIDYESLIPTVDDPENMATTTAGDLKAAVGLAKKAGVNNMACIYGNDKIYWYIESGYKDIWAGLTDEANDQPARDMFAGLAACYLEAAVKLAEAVGLTPKKAEAVPVVFGFKAADKPVRLEYATTGDTRIAAVHMPIRLR